MSGPVNGEKRRGRPADTAEALERLLRSFEAYYTVNRETPAEPFRAEAEFRMHDEQYFLIKSAKVTEYDSREFLFFAVTDRLTPELYESLDERAWEEGLSRVEVKPNHRNTDISLLILADRVDPEAAALIKKRRRYKSYRFGFRGWSAYKVIAYDLESGTTVQNRMGDGMRQIFSNIF